ncbi:MAG TPA: acyl-CoA dehydrogenase family protein, partial [Acidimicrobiales bacterium]|nr:acyl-CoA dehydrogenase family protein [Acidimicrobiales bacterium]
AAELGPYYTPERQQLQEVARQFAMKEVLPIANELDPVAAKIPIELRHKMGQLGFFGLRVPKAYGGLELGFFEYCLVTEELSRAWMSVASIIARAGPLPHQLGPERLRELYPRMLAGDYLGAVALSEPDAGSDLGSITCRAHRDGNSWVINGQKMWCTNADDAAFITVLARTEPLDPAHRHRGIGQLFIEKEPGTFPPGMMGTALRTIGYHGWRTFELSFDDFRVPTSALLQATGGFERTAASLSGARVHTAARAIGLARGALEDSIRYAAERVQFGRPIAHFQAIRFKIAWMATEVEAARRLTYYVANEIDQGRGQLREKEASMAKLFASEMAERVTSEALQVHGGYGYTTDFPVERYWRDARLTKIFEGTSEIQQRLISDRILGPYRD